MSIVSVGQVTRFTPWSCRDDKGSPVPGAPVYLIRPPSVMTRARWRREVGETGAPAIPPGREELTAVLRRGITEIVAEHQQPELLALADEYDAAFTEVQAQREKDDASPEARQAANDRLAAVSNRMGFLEGEIRGKYPPYAQALAARTFWFEVAPWVAARHFLCGWENVTVAGLPVEFAQVNGLVPEALLEQLPPDHIADVGWRAIGLTSANRDDEKNSAGA